MESNRRRGGGAAGGVSGRGDGGVGILPEAEGAVRCDRKVKKPLPPTIPLTGGSAYSLLIAWQKLSGEGCCDATQFLLDAYTAQIQFEF